MLYIMTTDDVAQWAYDTVIYTFCDHEWDTAQHMLRRLRRTHGNHFKLLDH